jgi:hypothetical protein
MVPPGPVLRGSQDGARPACRILFGVSLHRWERRMPPGPIARQGAAIRHGRSARIMSIKGGPCSDYSIVGICPSAFWGRRSRIAASSDRPAARGTEALRTRETDGARPRNLSSPLPPSALTAVAGRTAQSPGMGGRSESGYPLALCHRQSAPRPPGAGLVAASKLANLLRRRRAAPKHASVEWQKVVECRRATSRTVFR